MVLDAGKEVGVISGEPQPGPSVGLRGDGGAELGRHEVAEVLLGGAPAARRRASASPSAPAAIDPSVSFDVV